MLGEQQEFVRQKREELAPHLTRHMSATPLARATQPSKYFLALPEQDSRQTYGTARDLVLRRLRSLTSHKH